MRCNLWRGAKIFQTIPSWTQFSQTGQRKTTEKSCNFYQNISMKIFFTINLRSGSIFVSLWKLHSGGQDETKREPGRFPFNKNSGLKFRKFRVLNGTVHSGCTDPTQATARFVIVASQHTHHYALKVKSKYCLHPKEQSTVEKGWWKTKGGGILFRVESLWVQVKVKNSCELKRYVSQNTRTIRSNSWNCTANKFGVLGNLYSARLCCIHFTLIDKLL